MREPFFASLLLKMNFKPDPSADTIWANGIDVGYSPKFVLETSLDKLKGALVHEAMHIILMHHTRIGARDPWRWNIACDYVVNEEICDRFDLPGRTLRDPSFKGMTADEVYGMIPGPGSGEKGDNDGNRKGDPGQGSGKGTGQAPTGQAQGPDQPGGQPGPGPGDGSGKSGGDPGGCGEVRPYPGANGPASAAEKETHEAELKVAIRQAAQAAKAAGNIPGYLRELVEATLRPRVDWREYLREYADMMARNDYSWEHLDRSYLQRGIAVPDLHSPDVGEVVVGFDASGSQGKPELVAVVTELNAILEEFPQVDLHVIVCDTKVREAHHFTADDIPLKIDVKGRGGTRFKPVFDYVEEHGIEPKALVYMTDLEGSFAFDPPDYPVLWLSTNEDQAKAAPWGETIWIDLDR